MLKQYPTLRYVLQKAFWYFLTFLVAIAINFTLPRLGENNPVDIVMGMAALDDAGNAVYDTVAAMEHGKPVLDSTGAKVMKAEPRLASGFSQFCSYVKNVFKGDFGLSYSQYPKPVIEIIKESLPWTIAIQLPTILLGWIVGNLLGAFAAYKRGIFDKVFFPLAMFLNGVPFFVFGMLLVALFSITLGWFPAMGAYGPDMVPGFSWADRKSTRLNSSHQIISYA